MFASTCQGRYFLITCFTIPPDGPKSGPTGKKFSNLAIYLTDRVKFQTVSYTVITDPKNKIGDLRFFYFSLDRPTQIF